MKLLLVEDDPEIRAMLGDFLSAEGFTIVSAADGEDACVRFAAEPFDLVLLDLMLPKRGGIDVLRTIRSSGSTVPVLILSAKDTDSDITLGLGLGADDYITKPFSMRELMARVKANMRRTVSAEAEAPAAAKEGKLVISPEQSAVYKNGKPLDLSVREYDILNYLSKTPGRVVTREELMEKVWGYEYYGDLRAVDVAIRRLREKVEDEPAQPKYIITKRGMGYYYPEQP